MNWGETVGGGLIVFVSALFLVYAFKFESVMLLARGSSGMKEKSREPIFYWLGVCEWAFLALLGLGLVVVGAFPKLLD